jgi:L-aminopeptidase/D-esterase-like protein
MPKARAREAGLPFPGRPGPLNAITDVPGVEVGCTTLIEGDGPLVQGRGPVRTGVTAILPRGRGPQSVPVWAGLHALNGNGEMTGSHWIADAGHFIVVLATDAPMMPHQLNRLARRATIGIARQGTPGGNSSGDIFLAFSTANPIPLARLARGAHDYRFLSDDEFDKLYMAAVEATEEAIANALAATEDMTTLRPPGKVCRAIDMDALVALCSTGRTK